MKVIALVLIVLGVVGLVYGGFTYTQQSHAAKIGPIDISVNEKKTVPIPVWAGIAAIVVGGLLMLAPART